MSELPTRVSALEAGPRERLQAEARFVPTDEKVALVDAFSRTGVSGSS
jgi:hydroxymethylglutaryl-CoA lyase